jgi:LPS O-antigen subunit length determinant protein (WzzB/FepE family)
MSAERFLKPVEPDSPEGKNGKTFFFMDNLTGKPVYTTGTREDARKQVEEYVNRLNNAASEENYKLGKDLVNIKTREQLSRLAKTFSKRFSEEMIRVFEKFIVNG